MSQFLDCFGEADIAKLLERGRAALAPGGRLCILESFWDRQPNDVGELCVQGTEPLLLVHGEREQPHVPLAGLSRPDRGCRATRVGGRGDRPHAHAVDVRRLEVADER